MDMTSRPVSFRNTQIWAIQLPGYEELKRKLKIRFKWQDVPVNSRSAYNDKLIAVAKKYPSYSHKEIKNITSSLNSYLHIMTGDLVLGVEGKDKVKGVGFAEKMGSVSGPESELQIHWINNIEASEASAAIFKPELEIQKLTLRSINYLNSKTKNEIEKVYKINVDSTFSNKEIFHLPDELALEQETAFEENIEGRISIFYGTNRNRTGNKSINDYYGDEESDLKFGNCSVTIPKGHTQGEIERPGNWWIFKPSEKHDKHIMLESIVEMTKTNFIQELNKDLGQLKQQTALIFVHGYNVTFAEAARRTAQIAWDIPFNGMAGFFSWPSAGKTLQYLKDIEKADSTIPLLESFIETIVQDTNVKKLHLIGHSMGNRILTRAVNNLWSKQNFEPYRTVIDQIVLGAADIDRSVFINTILPLFKTVGTRRTVYSSDKDKALNFSEKLRGGRSRLGDAGQEIFVSQDLDTIDASQVKADGNMHSYIFETKELLADLYYLLENGFSPLQRRLRAVQKNKLNYWLFPR